jgi:hypothetical protein
MRLLHAGLGATKKSRPMPTYRERLKELRERAGLSGAKVASHLGFGSPTGYFRYETKSIMGSKPIPVDIVKRLSPLLVGRGEPKITQEEVMALTGVEEITRPSASVHEMPVRGGAQVLPVKYSVERGVFVPSDRAERSLGSAVICATPRYTNAVQFAAVLPQPFNGLPAGVSLHCVEASAYGSNIDGKKVVVLEPYAKSDLVEVILAAVPRNGGKPVSIDDNKPLEGRIVGVVIGSYAPE